MDLFENPSYSEDSYAAKFLNGVSIFPSDARIFHQAGYEYDDVVALGRADFDGCALRVDLTCLSGAPGLLTVETILPGVLRIRAGGPGAEFADASPMLLPLPEERPQAEFEDANGRYVFTSAGYRLELDKSPFCLRVLDPRGETIFESETEKLVGMYTAPPLGFRRRARESWAFLSWRIRNQDRLFGLGEKFTRFEKTGTRATIWTADTCGSSTTDMSYKAVPVLFNSAGWAMMLHASHRSFWELGSFSYATGGMMVEDEKLDLFFFLAPTLKEQVSAYTGLTGRPSLPPRWAFGTWMSRAAYHNRQQLEEVAARLREEQIPCDVLHLDPPWMARNYYNEIGVEVCNFDWNREAWGSPETLFADFAAQGYDICLWSNPYLSEDSPAYAEARSKGYLVQSATGGPSRLEFGLAAGMVDFTNPRARAWWQGKLAQLLRQGAAVFKVDFGDRVPEDALFADGRSGREMHNLYVHLYAETVAEVTGREKGNGFVWRRPGYIGSQRFSGCWAGDTQVSWEGMAGALRGGLSAAFTGDAFWSHDIGGFVGPKPSDELYTRWAQFGLLSPLARFHGTTPREPWHYGSTALEVVRHYARLRYALLPYLFGYAQESGETGQPLLRPLALEFPAEPRIDTVDDQYLLGPDLLVAPVFTHGARTRTLYLPAGAWWSYDRPGPPLAGPGYVTVDAPLERIPLFVREGAVIPYYKQVPEHLKGPAPREWILDIYPGDSRRRLVIAEPGFTVTIDYQCEGGAGRLEISPAPISISVRLIDRRPTFLRAGAGAQLQPGDSGTAFTVDAAQGVNVTFRS